MTQIERIRHMSVQELAEYLIKIDDEGFDTSFCDPRFCKKLSAHPDGNFECNEVEFYPDKDCIAAAVAWLESEV